jgi:SAM-dependent methyltransferase
MEELKLSCSVCEGSDIKELGNYRSTHPTFRNLSRVECRSCGMVFASPMPSMQGLEEYNASYFDSAHGGKAEGQVGTAFFSAIAGLRAYFVKKYLAKHKIKVNKVLEIGPGPGFFADVWMKANAGTNYFALETDSSCYDSLQKIGVQIIKGGVELSTKEPVDMVVMSHVLEHVTDPVGFVSFSTSLLKNDGILFIEVPCRDWDHKSIDEPHLLFFDKEPMKKLLEKLGFYDIQVSYYGQEINQLESVSLISRKYRSLRSRLISMGFTFPFSARLEGMETLSDPLERAVIAPFKAHKEASSPAWWLRAIAKKK